MAVEFDRYNLFFRLPGRRIGDAQFRLIEKKPRYEMRQITMYVNAKLTLNEIAVGIV